MIITREALNHVLNMANIPSIRIGMLVTRKMYSALGMPKPIDTAMEIYTDEVIKMIRCGGFDDGPIPRTLSIGEVKDWYLKMITACTEAMSEILAEQLAKQ